MKLETTVQQATPEQAINLVMEIESKYEKNYATNSSHFLVKQTLAKMVLNSKISEQQKEKLIKDADAYDLMKAISNKELNYNHLPYIAEIFIKLVNSLAWFNHLDAVDFLIDEIDHLENNCNAAYDEIEEYEYKLEQKSCNRVKFND